MWFLRLSTHSFIAGQLFGWARAQPYVACYVSAHFFTKSPIHNRYALSGYRVCACVIASRSLSW